MQIILEKNKIIAINIILLFLSKINKDFPILSLFKVNLEICNLQSLTSCLLHAFKVPLLWAMKGSYFGFGSPQQQVDMHAGSKNTFIVNMHLFLPYLHKESKTIRSTFNFSKPLLCVMLICSDWYDWSHLHFILPVKQCL